MVLKICGFRTVDELKQIDGLSVDFIGLNFISDAKPYISTKQALQLKPTLDRLTSKTVGLFKNQPIAGVKEIAQLLELDYIQLNGDEDKAYMLQLAVPIMRTIAIKPTTTVSQIESYISDHPAEIYILDRFKQGIGDPVNPILAAAIFERYPNRIFLAGGITEENILALLTEIKPFGLDISGGARTNGYINGSKVRNLAKLIRTV